MKLVTSRSDTARIWHSGKGFEDGHMKMNGPVEVATFSKEKNKHVQEAALAAAP